MFFITLGRVMGAGGGRELGGATAGRACVRIDYLIKDEMKTIVSVQPREGNQMLHRRTNANIWA
jgi:hypothetical protein